MNTRSKNIVGGLPSSDSSQVQPLASQRSIVNSSAWVYHPRTSAPIIIVGNTNTWNTWPRYQLHNGEPCRSVDPQRRVASFDAPHAAPVASTKPATSTRVMPTHDTAMAD